MLRVRRGLFLFRRQVHTLSRNGPSEILKKKVAELEIKRKMKNPRKNELFVETPEPKTWLDTATMPMILTAVGVALFAKLLMMYDDSKSQETIERKIQHAPAGQGTVRMLSREEWEEFQEVRPTTPFESKLARPNARLRTGEKMHVAFTNNVVPPSQVNVSLSEWMGRYITMKVDIFLGRKEYVNDDVAMVFNAEWQSSNTREDLKDWTIDVLTDALTRAEDISRHKSK